MSDIRFNQWLHQSGTGGVSQVASGAVGVGTTNPLADFYVRGDAQITGILTAGHIAMGSSITFGDDDRAYFGDGTDLQIYHSGSHSFIQDTGTGNLFIDSNSVQIRNAAASKTTAKFNENSSVELYYNNTERIRTTNTGAVVTGILTATSFSGGSGSTSSLDAGILDLKTGGNIRLRFASGGEAQFRGDTNPIASFDRGSANSTNVSWKYLGAGRGQVSSTSGEFRLTADGTIPMTFYSNSNERLKIDSDGRLIIGGGSSRAVGFEHRLQLEDTNDTPHSFSMISNRPNAYGVHLSFAKSRGSTRGSNTIVQDDDEIATLVFRGADGTDLGTVGAMIDVRVDGTPSANNIPASFEFHTANSSGNLAPRLIIDSSGNVLVGTTDTSLYNNGDSASEGIVLRGGDAIDIARKGDLQMTLNRQTNDGPHIAFYRSGGVKSYISTRSNAFCIDVGGTSEKLRISSSGNLLLGTTSDTQRLHVYNGNGAAGYKTALFNSNDTANGTRIVFANSGNTSGRGLGINVGGQTYGPGQNKASFGWYNTDNTFATYHSIMTITSDAKIGINETSPTANLHVGGAYNETPVIITGGAVGYNDALQVNTANGHRRFTVAGDGEIYGPSGGRKNWFDNGSFDCRGGRRNATSMDYGNHHAYGWVTDRFMSRNSVQWTRSTNVPTGKGFSYSTQTNGAGGQIMQAVELPDYGDMGVFTPGSYWCVSIWSTASMNHSGSAFSYDLGSTRTDVPGIGSGTYATTGETAAGTSTGTFNRYYRVYGPMPSSIISGATGLYFQWGFSAAGYATGWQLERVPTSTSKPTPYEHVHPAVTTARCRRYCWQNVNSRLHNGYKRHDSNIHWEERFPVPPTHMPSGSNQSVTPYGIILHDGGLLSNFQSVLQNPGVNSVSISEFDYRSGRFIIVGSTSYSPTHTTVPAWESQEYEIQHGFF